VCALCIWSQVICLTELQAEVALAIIQGMLIPMSSPPERIKLSNLPPDIASKQAVSEPDAYPCLIQQSMGPHSPLISLYHPLRSFGPIYSLKKDENYGEVIQYWKESDALEAEKAGGSVGITKLSLQSFNPRIVCCSVYVPALHKVGVFCSFTSSERTGR
jgi:hypothetical protein